jgi:hypothetical protein
MRPWASDFYHRCGCSFICPGPARYRTTCCDQPTRSHEGGILAFCRRRSGGIRVLSVGTNDRFWAIGYGAILSSAFTTSGADDGRRRRPAAADRLDVILLTVMTFSPALPDFHDSLSDKQKAALDRAICQFRPGGQAGDIP